MVDFVLDEKERGTRLIFIDKETGIVEKSLQIYIAEKVCISFLFNPFPLYHSLPLIICDKLLRIFFWNFCRRYRPLMCAMQIISCEMLHVASRRLDKN